jgi:putative hydrolase of the HAD superfamily
LRVGEEQAAMSIEAVIFDFGGVITASPFEAFNRYEAERGLPKDIIRRVNATNPQDNAWAHLERGDISAAEFDRRFRAESLALGHEIPGADVMRELSGAIRPRMVAALKLCKTRFKVGCITNNFITEKGDPHRMASAMGEVLDLFDAVIESARAGVRKPDPRIYQMMCELLGVPPQACVYLDDLGINCKPAAQLGMTAIKVVDVDQTLAELARATGLAFDQEIPA